jgi:hypothetical protein
MSNLGLVRDRVKKSPVFQQGSFLLWTSLRHGIADIAEGIANAWTQQAHNTNYNKRHESEDDRIFDQALTSFL